MYTVSKRGLELQSSTNKYVRLLPQVFESLFDPKDNHDGYINLCIAENVLNFELLKAKAAEAAQTLPDLCSVYGDLTGQPFFKPALCKFLEQRVLHFPVDPSAVVVGNGVGPLLNNLALSLFERGDIVSSTEKSSPPSASSQRHTTPVPPPPPPYDVRL
jgi:aspartate/methionine/tyrosine aminotransferase